MPYFGENVRLEFTYEKLDENTISSSLDRVVFLDSVEAYSNTIATTLFLQQMYENIRMPASHTMSYELQITSYEFLALSIADTCVGKVT